MLSNQEQQREAFNTAPGPVNKKQTRPYSKRPFFIGLVLAGVSLFLILTAGNSLSPKTSNIAAKQGDAPKYTAGEPVLNWQAYADPSTTSDTNIGELQDIAYNMGPDVSGVNKTEEMSNTVDKQWLEHQRMAYLSRGMIGDWPIANATETTHATSLTGNALAPTANNNYLDLLARQADTPSVGSQQDFFDKKMAAPGSLSSTRQPQLAPYKIPAGTIIPCVAITGINSDLPGNATAQVSENVYDFVNPYVCLIPQGSRVFGTYSSSVSYGQRRVQVRWTNITYPDGSSLNLEGMAGVDKAGYSGLHDKYYPHYGRMLTAALLTSTLVLLPDLILDESTSSSSGTTVIINTGDGTSNAKSEIARAAADTIADAGKKILDKQLNLQPTIQIRPGTRFNIQANADILFDTAWPLRR